MPKLVAIVGSYRKGGITDSAVDAILEGAKEKGTDITKIYLLDKNIEFCTNCRVCTQEPGTSRGKCTQQDDMESILEQIDAADALVLAAPVNFYNLTALFRRFMERCVGYAYWPWGKPGPEFRNKKRTKRAALVTSSAMPSPVVPMASGAPRALKLIARTFGARPIAMLTVGLAASHPKQALPLSTVARARQIGSRLV